MPVVREQLGTEGPVTFLKPFRKPYLEFRNEITIMLNINSYHGLMVLSYQEAMKFARQVTEALDDGHRQGQPHLNLRPSNIMLSASGVKLVNYGISRLTSLNRNPNTPAKKYMDDYLALEQISRKVDNELSDIYALCTILYEIWSFVVIVLFELLLTILRQPENWFYTPGT